MKTENLQQQKKKQDMASTVLADMFLTGRSLGGNNAQVQNHSSNRNIVKMLPPLQFPLGRNRLLLCSEAHRLQHRVKVQHGDACVSQQMNAVTRSVVMSMADAPHQGPCYPNHTSSQHNRQRGGLQRFSITARRVPSWRTITSEPHSDL